MYRLVIFDLDGTLLNTLGDLAAAGNHALELMGFPVHEEEAYKLFVGNGIPNLIHRILPEGHSGAEHKRCYELFTEYYSVHKSDRTVPYAGMTELVTKLCGSGVICCVNTNKAHEFSCELVRAAFGGSIRGVIGYGAGFEPKPSPDAALELCRRFGADKSEALYVGDSNVDARTAAAAGIDCCSVLWGFRSYEELSACSPRYIAASTEELYGIIVGK